MKRFYLFLRVIALGAVIMAGLAGCNTLQSVEVSSEPARTVYGQGQELSRTGLVVTGHFKKDSREITNEAAISGYNKNNPGKQTVTVTLKGKSAAFTVTVVPVQKLSISRLPAATVFPEGDELDMTGFSALAEFENRAVPNETLPPERLTFLGYDKRKTGVQTITADYYGKRASFDVRVAALSGIAVASPPDKTDYFTGEDLDLEGLVVRGTWDGLGEKPVVITQGNLSSFDKNRAGKQEVFITYLGKTASFPVTFVSMQAISITRPPAKLNYENGEELNLAGMTVQGTRTGAASIELVDVSRLKISGYDRFKGGNQVVTVTIGGRSAAFRVTVAPNPFVGTWQGTKIDTFGKGHAIPVTFIMTEDSWSMSFETEEYIGTYTRDNDSGKRAALLPGKSGYSGSTAPEAAEILSPTALKLTGGTFGRDGLILEKVR